jgi:hypothetical protein
MFLILLINDYYCVLYVIIFFVYKKFRKHRLYNNLSRLKCILELMLKVVL